MSVEFKSGISVHVRRSDVNTLCKVINIQKINARAEAFEKNERMQGMRGDTILQGKVECGLKTKNIEMRE